MFSRSLQVKNTIGVPGFRVSSKTTQKEETTTTISYANA
jgi:hypothetical protein